MFENIDLGAILEEKTRELVKGLLNFIEQLSSSLREAHAEIQRLRDEINRLKGEQGKPDIKGNVETEAPKNHSSEKERKKPRQPGQKLHHPAFIRDSCILLQFLRPHAQIERLLPQLHKTPQVRFHDRLIVY